MNISNYVENAWLNTFRGVSFSVATVYMSLHTASPGDTGANEVTGGGYSRKVVTFNAPSGGSMTMAAAVEFPNMPAVTVTHIGLWDSATGGNFLFWGALSSSINVPEGFTLRITDLTLTLD